MKKNLKVNLIWFGLIIGLFLILKGLELSGIMNLYYIQILMGIGISILMGLGTNLVLGFSGQFTLGQAGFMAIGAYSSAIITGMMPTYDGFYLSMVVGVIIAAIVALIFGLPTLRLKGDYLAIVTLAFGEIIKNIINVLYIGLDEKGLHFSLLEQHFTLAEGGSMIINGPMGVGGVQKLSSFSSGVVLILITLFLVLNLIHSRTGRAIMAVRDNKIAAESIGLSVTRYKLLAFVISAVFAGMAGTLYAMNFSTVTASKFDFNTSILILVFVVLGGLGNIWGSIIAAALLTVLPELLRSMNDYRMLIYAILLIVMMIFNNSGAKKRLTEYFSAQKEKRTAKKAAGKGVN